MKKTISVFLAALLCLSFCLSVGADGIQPRWQVLTSMSSDLSNYYGIYNNAEIRATAQCGSDKVRIDMTVTIVRWNGTAYVDTSTRWTDSGYGAVNIVDKFRLSAGNYKARTSVTLYDADGNYIETVVVYSHEIVI